jgi:hypothetical protein
VNHPSARLCARVLVGAFLISVSGLSAACGNAGTSPSDTSTPSAIVLGPVANGTTLEPTVQPTAGSTAATGSPTPTAGGQKTNPAGGPTGVNPPRATPHGTQLPPGTLPPQANPDRQAELQALVKRLDAAGFDTIAVADGVTEPGSSYKTFALVRIPDCTRVKSVIFGIDFTTDPSALTLIPLTAKGPKLTKGPNHGQAKKLCHHYE